MALALFPEPNLPPASAQLPGDLLISPNPSAPARIRLGCVESQARVDGGGPPGQILMAPDLLRSLCVPFAGLRFRARDTEDGGFELGPAVGILYAGTPDSISLAEAEARADLYFGHLTPVGLQALCFDRAIDFSRNVAHGYLVRPAEQGGGVTEAEFPIPAAVRLAWSIRREVIDSLRRVTGNRTFNWVRNLGKWQLYNVLADDSRFRPHLPETRLLRSEIDLAALLVRYPSVFVKHVHSVQGSGVARVCPDGMGFSVTRVRNERSQTQNFPDLPAVYRFLDMALDPGRRIVQRGLNLKGREGRSLHFRVLTVRERSGGWRVPHMVAQVASDQELLITNLHNGAVNLSAASALEDHIGLTAGKSRQVIGEMERICLEATQLLAERLAPLGILGFDLGLESGSDHPWLLEANTVPGWRYPPEVRWALARSQTDYALGLTNFPGPSV